MPIDLVHIGFSNMVAAGRVLAVASPGSAPVKRMVQDARKEGRVVDMTFGAQDQGGDIVLDSGHLLLAAIQPETIAAGWREG